MMRDLYVPMRRNGGTEHKEAFKQKLSQLGLEDARCFTQKNRTRNFGSSYFVDYMGSRRELYWPLKGSKSRNLRFGFRSYYF